MVEGAAVLGLVQPSEVFALCQDYLCLSKRIRHESFGSDSLVLAAHLPETKGGKKKSPCVWLENRQNSFSAMPHVYNWFNLPTERNSSNVPATKAVCQKHLSNRWWEPCLWWSWACWGCLKILGKFKAHTAYFVWKGQITYPKAESLPFPFPRPHLLFLFPHCFFSPFVSFPADICPLPGLLLRAAKVHIYHYLTCSTLW